MGFKQYLGNFILIFLISFVSLWSCANSPEKAKVENVIPSQSVKSSSKKTDNPIDQIKTVIKKYKKSSSIKMLVEREIYSSYLDETKTSEGTLYFSKGRLRLEIEKPDKYLLLMAKNVIWIENHLGQDMGGVQVSKIAASKNLKQKNALLAFLLMTLKLGISLKLLALNKLIN